MSVPCLRRKEGERSRESADAFSELHCGCWELDLGRREEQAVLSLIRHLAISSAFVSIISSREQWQEWLLLPILMSFSTNDPTVHPDELLWGQCLSLHPHPWAWWGLSCIAQPSSRQEGSGYWAWWCVPLILALGREAGRSLRVLASQGYIYSENQSHLPAERAVTGQTISIPSVLSCMGQMHTAYLREIRDQP